MHGNILNVIAGSGNATIIWQEGRKKRIKERNKKERRISFTTVLHCQIIGRLPLKSSVWIVKARDSHIREFCPYAKKESIPSLFLGIISLFSNWHGLSLQRPAVATPLFYLACSMVQT